VTNAADVFAFSFFLDVEFKSGPKKSIRTKKTCLGSSKFCYVPLGRNDRDETKLKESAGSAEIARSVFFRIS
jgi:hypothetical protein